jgi:hypothetical protein
MNATSKDVPPLAGLRYNRLAEMVRRCCPTARRIVATGIGDTEHKPIDALVTELLGHSGPEAGQTEEESGFRYDQWTQATYALGIAVGLQLRASAFDDDGRVR